MDRETPLVDNSPKVCHESEPSSPTSISPSSKGYSIDATPSRSNPQQAFRAPTGYWQMIAKGWRKIRRPRVPSGMKRIEWTCVSQAKKKRKGFGSLQCQDCGHELYGDFNISDPNALKSLEVALQNCDSESQSNSSLNSDPGSLAGTSSNPTTSTNAASGGVLNSHVPTNQPSTSQVQKPGESLTEETQAALPRYLAICVNTGGIYVTLSEISVTRNISDAALFDMIKTSYQKLRGFRIRFAFLLRPVGVEFVHVRCPQETKLLNIIRLRGLLTTDNSSPSGTSAKGTSPSVTDLDASHRRASPTTSSCRVQSSRFRPCHLKFSSTTPPEVFIHYLQHGDGDLNPVRSIWAPRIPKRLHSPIVNAGMPSYGWGIHIVEGTNRELVFWIFMFTIFASILTTVLWSSFKHDVQGGSGLGSLIVALPSVVLMAWLFRLGVT